MKTNEIKEPAPDFEELKNLLFSPEWPMAIAPQLIGQSSEDAKFARADDIIEIFLGQTFKDKKVLDFGCGEGYVSKRLFEAGALLSVGYDIKQTGSLDWENTATGLLTTDWAKVEANQPYDVVILYDVFDHLENESQEDVLKKIKNIIHPRSKVFLRCHPVCSRHSSHGFEAQNKAYMNLVFTKDELTSLGIDVLPCAKILTPIAHYHHLFSSNGFDRIMENVESGEVEPFFMNNSLVRARIMNFYNLNSAQGFPEFQMKQCYHDYVLKLMGGHITEPSINTEYEYLRTLLYSSKWPEAVDPELICSDSSEKDYQDRANAILAELIQTPMKSKRFLDFGCGMGHCVKAAKDLGASLAVGYDIIKDPKSILDWENFDSQTILTTSKETLLNYKQSFDIILLYDVLDHYKEFVHPHELMNFVKELKSPNGKIYLRCHPSSSRHSGHLYNKINKAFIHLIAAEEELKDLGYQYEPAAFGSLWPLATYRGIFAQAGLKIELEEVMRRPVEGFFKTDKIIKNRIMKKFGLKENATFPDFQLEQCFLDYVLS